MSDTEPETLNTTSNTAPKLPTAAATAPQSPTRPHATHIALALDNDAESDTRMSMASSSKLYFNDVINELKSRYEDEVRRKDDELRLLNENYQHIVEELAQLRKAIERKKAVPEEEDAVMPDALTVPPEPFPDSPFAINRRVLNEALLEVRREQLASSTAERKLTGSKRKAIDFVACSSVKWSRIQGVYSDRMRFDDEAFPCQEFESPDITSIMEEVRRQQEHSGMCKEQNEERRKQGISTILNGAAALLKDKAVQVRYEVALKNAAVFSNGVADMLVTRDQKRKLLVVEAKKEDFDQGKAQDLVLMDVAIAENEKQGVKITPVFGIVSTFTEWNFYRYDVEGIKYTFDQINEVRSLESDVRRVIGRVYNMLKED
ncbi:hypothetical protein FI667_g5261, partial [Globisporangium splendens]